MLNIMFFYKTNINILSNSIIAVKQRRQRVESTNDVDARR